MCNMSPFGDYLFCSDVNCFYMAGKAWALGYIPYVDFIDSKGPLLFLIFAIGYLISPENTYGVYILASLSTAITLILIYKTAYYFTKSTYRAIFVAVCCSAALFFKPYYGYGPRTEQFIIPFSTLIMYFLTTKIEKLNIDSKYWIYFGIILGICTAVFLLTKYVYIVYPLSAFICSCIFLNNHREKGRKFLYISCSYILSFAVFCLPFLCYMLLTESLDACIWSYFKLSAQGSTQNTQLTLQATLFSHLTRFIKSTYSEPAFYVVMASIATFCLPFYRRQLSIRNRLVCILVFSSLVFCCSIGLYRYYLLVYFPLFAFLIILLTECRFLNNSNYTVLSLIVIILSISSYLLSIQWKKYKRIPIAPADYSRNYQEVENLIKAKFRAKIIYMDQLAQGFGIRSGAIPACQAWCRLPNLPVTGRELEEIRKNAIINKVPDFIFTFTDTHYINFLQNAGYKHTLTILEGSQMRAGIMLWSRE